MTLINLAVLTFIGAAAAQLPPPVVGTIVTIDQTTTANAPVFLPPSGTNLLPVPPPSSSVSVVTQIVVPVVTPMPSLASGTSTFMIPQIPGTSSSASFMTIQTQNMSDPSESLSISVLTSTVVLPSSEVSGSSVLPTITRTMTVSGSATSSMPPAKTSNAAGKKGMGGSGSVLLAVVLGVVGA
jgi:hypothetical protein